MGLTVAPMMLYNMSIKLAGNIVTLKTYEETQSYGYQVKGVAGGKGDKLKEIEGELYVILNESYSSLRYVKIKLIQALKNYNSYNAKKERFEKSCYRAKSKIFDLVVCNVNKHLDYEGKNQRSKFLTLTFKENLGDIEKANAEVTKFLKRLSYYKYRVNKNVIKYICVPELQERGAWHYHIILFNCPFIPFNEYLRVWNNGGVYIKALPKTNDGIMIAKYITKYISKGIEIKEDISEDKEDTYTMNETEDKLGDKRLSDYENYLRHGMVNKKRYQCSRGLYKPLERKLKITRVEWSMYITYLIDNAKIDKEGGKITYFKEINNEHRGQINILVSEVWGDSLKRLKAILEGHYNVNRIMQSQEYNPDWKHLSNILFNKKMEEAEYKKTNFKHIQARNKRRALIKQSIINYPAYIRGY